MLTVCRHHVPYAVFDEIANRIETADPFVNVRNSDKPGRPPIPFRMRFMWLLQRLATPVRYHSIAKQYGRQPEVVRRGTIEAMRLINAHLSAEELRQVGSLSDAVV